MKFSARPYQLTMRDFILAHKRCAIWAGMGLGKTSSVLSAIDLLRLTVEGPVLVIAPLRVARSVWPEEVMKWDQFKHLRVSTILGSKAERAAALKRKADIYCINYENLPWLIEHLGDAWPFAITVVDESTRLKGFRTRQGTARARALAKRAHRSPRLIELTGTPAPNGLQDLWGQVWFLDRGGRLGTSFEAFKERWFRTVVVGDDRFATRLEPLPFAQTQIEGALADICLSLDAADHFDLAEPIVNNIMVELPDYARRMYRGMEREMFLALADGTEIEAFSAAAKTMKCLQLANGAIYTNPEATTWSAVHEAKLDALEDVIEEAAGMPVLVAYHFRSDLARLKRAFPQGRELDQKPQTLRDWNAGKIPMLFAHPASAGHGLNLQDGGNIICFFSLNWNLEERQQIIERIGPVRQAQAGHKRPVFIHNIVAARTLDEVVLERIETKREVQDLLLEAMKSHSTKE